MLHPPLRVQALPGHKDAVTCLAFREGTHELYSGSLDRSIKLWSLDDLAYVDTLFGHQAGEALIACCARPAPHACPPRPVFAARLPHFGALVSAFVIRSPTADGWQPW